MFAAELNFLKLLQTVRTDFLNLIFELITALGEETIPVILIAVLYFVFDKNLARRLFFVTVTSLSINGIIKNLVRFPRPFASSEITCVRPDTATGYSFPSGHTQNFATWSFTLAVVFKKLWLWIVAAIFTVLIGFSRMYLGAHYPSDVIAGAILGILATFVLNAIYDRILNKNALYATVIFILTPFAVIFLLKTDPLFEDFFKAYGMMLGFLCSTVFEESFVSMNYNTSLCKKILRVIISIAVVLIIKEGTNSPDNFSSVRLNMLIDVFRYFAIVFAGFGLCPLVFKKLKI